MVALPACSSLRTSQRWASYPILVLCLFASWCAAHAVRSQTRDYGSLPPQALAAVAELSNPATFLDTSNAESLLSQILIPRPPDTDNSRKVREAILDVFRKQLGAKDSSTFSSMDWTAQGKLGWYVEQQTFTANTPEGPKQMTNIVLTKNPAAPRKLVVAAHYDSKYFPASSGMENFVGATDSAAPCAMMVDLAVALDDALDARERRIHAVEQAAPSIAQETTLQLVFFDGEEAYRTWTHEDSIYGSKALAKLWTTTFWDATHFDSSRSSKLEARRYRSTYGPIEYMNTIEHMILLDLLGAPDPTVPSYYDNTKWLHAAMTDAERRLKEAQVLWPKADTAHQDSRSFFSQARPWGGIEDDHLPFLHAGVPILHAIPSPFPSVWHKLSDDATALDYATMHAWCMILRLTIAEYLELDIGGMRGAIPSVNEPQESPTVSEGGATPGSNTPAVGKSASPGIVPHKDPSAKKDADAEANAGSKVEQNAPAGIVQSASAEAEKAASAGTGQGTASGG